LNAQVLLAAGQYDGARQQLEQSLAEIRSGRIQKGLDTVDGMIRGAPFLGPTQQGGLGGPIVAREELFNELTREARLGFELGLILIEMGKPRDAVKAFVAALEAYPRAIIYRPIMDYYVDLIKKAGISDVKLPPDPAVYVQDDELSIKFEPAPEPAKDAKEAKDPGKPAAKADEKKAEPQKKN
jgi:hypothetical protein